MITGTQIAEKAKSLLLMGTIPYAQGGETIKGMDCQGLVEWTLRELGMEADYAGTNDMWRNLLSEKGTIEDCVVRHGAVPLGALIFIVDSDGGEPAKYQGDGEGNCWHVYLKISDEMLIHASAANLMVTTRLFADETIKNGGPNSYGLISGVDYGVTETAADSAADAGDTAQGAPTAAQPAAVVIMKTWKPRYRNLTFAEGCMGNGVRELQTGLNRLGNTLDVDGRFGPDTEQALLRFQQQQGLETDGVAGPKTWQTLIAAVNA